MHLDVSSTEPGKCLVCGMPMNQSEARFRATPYRTEKGSFEKTSYTPLVVIIGLILLTAIFIEFRDGIFSLKTAIATFMAGFFLVFAGFKILDLSGFAQGYATYDLLAKRWFSYGYVYPFIEMFFGLAMIVAFELPLLLFTEFLVMSFSGVGVLLALAQKNKFQCVCLGTIIKVPLTSVTLVEDFGMAALAGILLLTS